MSGAIWVDATIGLSIVILGVSAFTASASGRRCSSVYRVSVAMLAYLAVFLSAQAVKVAERQPRLGPDDVIVTLKQDEAYAVAACAYALGPATAPTTPPVPPGSREVR